MEHLGTMRRFNPRFTSAGSLFAARAAAGVAQSVMLVWVAHDLSAAQFGSFNSFFGVGNFLVAIADLGVGTLLLRERARERDNPLIPTILRINAWGMASLAVILIAIYFLIFRNSLAIIVAALVGAWILLERNSETWLAIAIADMKVATTAVVIVLRRIVPLGFMAVLVTGAHINAAVAFGVAQVAGGALGVFLTRYALRDSISRQSSARSRLVIAKATHFWLAVGASQARELEPGILASVTTAAESGAYGLGSRLARPVQLLATSAAQVMLSGYARATASASRRAVRRIAVAALASSCVAPASWLATGPLLHVLSLDRYHATAVVNASILATVWVAFSSPVASVLQARDLERAVAITNVTSAVLGLGAVAAGALIGGAFWATVAVGTVYFIRFWALFLISEIDARPRKADAK
jgi:O-antigen/teichoic acid export membrane protein